MHAGLSRTDNTRTGHRYFYATAIVATYGFHVAPICYMQHPIASQDFPKPRTPRLNPFKQVLARSPLRSAAYVPHPKSIFPLLPYCASSSSHGLIEWSCPPLDLPNAGALPRNIKSMDWALGDTDTSNSSVFPKIVLRLSSPSFARLRNIG
jgi:hypothetical protein